MTGNWLAKMGYLTRKIKNIEDSGSYSYDTRVEYVNTMASMFCAHCGICKCKITLRNEPRPYVDNTKKTLYGEYRGKHIVLYNLTPKTKKPVKLEVLFDTLLHELLHHTDQFEYGLYAAHDNKFYKRLEQLKNAVMRHGK